jgi:hypothetical protein
MGFAGRAPRCSSVVPPRGARLRASGQDARARLGGRQRAGGAFRCPLRDDRGPLPPSTTRNALLPSPAPCSTGAVNGVRNPANGWDGWTAPGAGPVTIPLVCEPLITVAMVGPCFPSRKSGVRVPCPALRRQRIRKGFSLSLCPRAAGPLCGCSKRRRLRLRGGTVRSVRAENRPPRARRTMHLGRPVDHCADEREGGRL